MASDDQSEAQFIARLVARDESAFNELVLTYERRVFALVFRMLGRRDEAEDLSQEVFVQVFKAIDQFRGDSKLSTWIYRLSVNVALQHIRRAKRRRWFILTSDTEVLERTLPVDIIGQVEGRQMLQKIYELLDTIKPKKRTVYILHELQGMDVDEISEVVGVPTNTVKSRLFHARKEMLAKLAKARMM